MLSTTGDLGAASRGVLSTPRSLHLLGVARHAPILVIRTKVAHRSLSHEGPKGELSDRSLALIIGTVPAMM